jgi:hypothetical protein
MDLFPPKQYKSNPHNLLNFINMMNLWEVPGLYSTGREIVVATNIWTGILNAHRPMATLFLASSSTHEPMSGAVILIDDTEANEQAGIIELRLEARRYHDFNPNEHLAPIIDERYRPQDAATLARRLREVIVAHWKNTPWQSPLAKAF